MNDATTSAETPTPASAPAIAPPNTTKPCPCCGRDLARLAPMCPQCGFAFKTGALRVTLTESWILVGVKIGVGLMVVLPALAVVFFVLATAVLTAA